MMRIHALSLHNVRGITQLELTGLPDTGVIVIHGDNEAGKSTIMDAIDACLNYKYSGFPKNIKSLVPADGSGWPGVRLDLEIGPYRMEVYKQFSSSAASKKCELKLISPKRALLHGDAADNELRSIISEYLDTDLLDALFVRQGKLNHSLAAAGIPSVESSLQARNSWGSADDSAGGDAVAAGYGAGTEQAQEESRLLAAVNAEYKRYYTDKTAKPAKELKEAEEKLNSAQAQYDEAQAQFEKVASHVAEFEQLDEREKDAAAEIPAAERELEDWERKKEQAETVQQRLIDAVEAVKLAEKQKNSESELLEARIVLFDELKQAQSRRDDFESQLRAAEVTAVREAEAISELRDAKNSAETEYRKQRERHKTARVASQEFHDTERAVELRELIEKVEGIDSEIADAREALGALPAYVDNSAWQRLRQAHDDVVVEQKLADAHSARLELRSESLQTLTVDDGTGSREVALGCSPQTVVGESDQQTCDDAEPEKTIGLSDGVSLRFGDITAVYRSARRETTEKQSAQSAVEQARETLDELLAEFHCNDVSQAEQIYKTCSLLDEKIIALRNQRAGVVGEKDLDALRQQLAGFERITDVSVLSNGDEIGAELAAAEKAEEEARIALEDCASRLAAYDAMPGEAEALRIRERCDLASERVAEIEEKVAERADPALMDKLRENLELAKRKWEQAINEREAASVAADAADVSMTVRNWEGAAAHVAQLHDIVRESKHRKLALNSHIDAATGAAERLQKAEAQLENYKIAFAVVERRAQAAARLRETLLKHRDAARQRYMEPFARELERFARVVFDHSVSFELDENLAISKRMIRDTALDTEHLSGGAQEQLGLLARFAIAALTARGEVGQAGSNELPAIPVPVMIDDALGSTDAHRLKLMAALFSEISRQTQVFVLTCMPQRYSRVVGAQQFSMRQLTSG